MQKHKKDILKKSKMNDNDFNQLLQLILTRVLIVPNEALIPYKKEAYEIIKNIDPNDVLFIACALAYPRSIIWSDDKALKKQSKIKILNTKEIIKALNLNN